MYFKITGPGPGRTFNNNQYKPSANSQVSVNPSAYRTNRRSHLDYDISKIPIVKSFQPKLTINQPNDKYEQEADHVADRVIHMENNASSGSYNISGRKNDIQRKCAACEKEEELHRKPQISSAGSYHQPVAGPALQSRLNSSGGKGSPLPRETNDFMSRAIGKDFSRVRVHTGNDAVRMNQEINARAFTYGSDIYFNSGEYNPGTQKGRHLLGHELTHVVQQQKSILRKPKAPKKENIWGFNVTRSMCGCYKAINDEIENEKHFIGEYHACDKPANKTPDAIEKCISDRNPDSKIFGTTGPGGDVAVHATASNPCDRIIKRSIRVHEIKHSQQADGYARKVGGAFYHEWKILKNKPKKRFKILQSKYPAATNRYMSLWNNAKHLVHDEIQAYTFQRKFLWDVRWALGRICH